MKQEIPKLLPNTKIYYFPETTKNIYDLFLDKTRRSFPIWQVAAPFKYFAKATPLLIHRVSFPSTKRRYVGKERFLQVFNYFHFCLCSFLLKQKTMKRQIFISILVLGRIFDSKDCRFTFEVKIRFIHIAHIPFKEKEHNGACIDWIMG